MITTSCELGFDADLLVRAARGEIGREGDESLVRDHVGACEACSRRLRALRAAKDAWTDRVSEPEAVMRARDARAMTRLRDGRSRRSPSTFLAGVIVGATVVGSLILFRGRPGREERAMSSAAISATVAPTTAVVAPTGPPAGLAVESAPASSPAAPAFVVKRACSSCNAGNVELGPGTTLPEHAAVEVPSGGALLLAFSLAEAVAEPDHGLTVEGPAHAVVDRGAIDVERGKAKLVGDMGGGGDVRVRTPHLVVTAARGRLTIDSDEGGTRLAVLTGTASITTAAGEQRELGAGDRLHIDAGGRVMALESVAVPAPSAPPAVPRETPEAARAATPDERWSAAMSALDGGDRAQAESELRRLVAETQATQPLHRRASFTLAELELARGDAREARPRLDAVMRGPEEQLAEDAAVLLARSYPTPGERALVWAAYLGTLPPSPRRERAILERVRALVASGADARAAATGCEGQSPACVESRALAGRSH